MVGGKFSMDQPLLMLGKYLPSFGMHFKRLILINHKHIQTPAVRADKFYFQPLSFFKFFIHLHRNGDGQKKNMVQTALVLQSGEGGFCLRLLAVDYWASCLTPVWSCFIICEMKLFCAQIVDIEVLSPLKY